MKILFVILFTILVSGCIIDLSDGEDAPLQW